MSSVRLSANMSQQKNPPQSFISSYAPRLRMYSNSLLTPVIQPIQAIAAPLSRTTKRGTVVINYAEDGYDDYDEDDDSVRRRPTGLRSIRQEDLAQTRHDTAEKVGKETDTPVEVQGVWRDWMGKGRPARSELQNGAQKALPLTLIPIRIDLDIPSYNPPAALPIPQGINYSTIDTTLPVYRPQETAVPYRLKDKFLWNLHECSITTDHFAQTMVQDLDLPNRAKVSEEMSKQIRTQLEEYAGVALHPLFHQQETTTVNGVITTIQEARDISTTPAVSGNSTPMRSGTNGTSTPLKNVTSGIDGAPTPLRQETSCADIPETPEATSSVYDPDEYNPDDTYRCIINLSVNLSNNLYTDKFEWSLLHGPGTAEAFAKQTCADMGLAMEWVPAISHAIYEAVLKLKKEACESGGIVGGTGREMANDAAHGAEAGWRYDPEHLADDWEPKVEELSKEEMEKREGDRERQIRRVRRETARFSSNAGMMGGIPQPAENRGYFDNAEPAEERMGRGERSKKKKRFRSLSPLRNGSMGRDTPDNGYGGGGSLAENERNTWRCAHCKTWGTTVWAVRDGPLGARTLCNNCGYLYEKHGRTLPKWQKDLHRSDPPPYQYR